MSPDYCSSPYSSPIRSCHVIRQLRHFLAEMWISSLPRRNYITAAARSFVTPSSPPEFSRTCLEVLGGASSVLLDGSPLKLKPYKAFPIIGWNKHVETICAAFFRSVPDVSLRRECIRTVDDGSISLDWCVGDDRLIPDDAPVLILLVVLILELFLTIIF